ASLTAKGTVQLSSATNSNSETLAATPRAVKAAYDLAASKASASHTHPWNQITGVPSASLTAKGTVQLSSATNSNSETLAATPKAVKAAYDLANSKAAAAHTHRWAQITDAPVFSSVARVIMGKQSIKDILDYLGLGDGSGRLIQCQVFKSSGTYTPTKGTKFIIVEIVGGGGAGGGCQVGYPNNAACGGGGMSGEYVKARVDNPTVTTVTIGYGGTGASASVGAPGGTTSFGNTIIAKGGLGGNVLAEGTAPGVVGPYGAYTEPGFTGANIIGSGSGYSSPGVRYSGSLAMGGPGGDSILGAGAGSQAIVGEGINANGHGGGGGGACVYGGATQQRAGGSGMAGIAIIWEYA
ncbi:tail fiber protein, partial [Escherichia coli]|uniref:phage tail protein n=3 Tax=Escherichia coli TaxID=562 RepID=UPI001C632984